MSSNARLWVLTCMRLRSNVLRRSFVSGVATSSISACSCNFIGQNSHHAMGGSPFIRTYGHCWQSAAFFSPFTRVCSFFSSPSSMASHSQEQVVIGERRFGFLGSGKMAQSIVGGLLSSGLLNGSKVCMTDCFGPENAMFFAPIRQIQEAYGVEYLQENPPMVEKSDVIFVCVKPNGVQSVLRNCNRVLGSKLVVSIAAGVTVSDLESVVPSSTRVIRVMPNIPCLVQQGAGIFSRGSMATDEDVTMLKAVFSAIFPVMEEIPETQMNAATALSGSGPAYILMVMEALADGGVRLGLTRALAQKLAIQTVLGTAVLARDSGAHMAQLRDEVCSPGGSTIAGTHVLERAAIRAAFSDCVVSAKIRNDELAPPKTF